MKQQRIHASLALAHAVADGGRREPEFPGGSRHVAGAADAANDGQVPQAQSDHERLMIIECFSLNHEEKADAFIILFA
jgi:hypothetical protein